MPRCLAIVIDVRISLRALAACTHTHSLSHMIAHVEALKQVVYEQTPQDRQKGSIQIDKA